MEAPAAAPGGPLPTVQPPGGRRAPVAKEGWRGDLSSPGYSAEHGLTDTAAPEHHSSGGHPNGGVLSDAALEGTNPSTAGGFNVPGTPSGSSLRNQRPPPAPIGSNTPKMEDVSGAAAPQRRPSNSPLMRRPSQDSRASGHSAPRPAADPPPDAASAPRPSAPSARSRSSGSLGQGEATVRMHTAPLSPAAAAYLQAGPAAPAPDPDPEAPSAPAPPAAASPGGMHGTHGEVRWDPELAGADWRAPDPADARDAALSGMAESILVKRVEYIPVSVARQKVKELCAQMARTRHEHLVALEKVERHYNTMKAEAERRVSEYVETLAARHREEVIRLREDHARRSKEIRSELLGRIEDEVESSRQRAEQIEKDKERRLLDMEREAMRKRKKEEMKHQSALRLLQEEREAVLADLARMKAEVRREADEAHAARGEAERALHAAEEEKRRELERMREEKKAYVNKWDEERQKLQDALERARVSHMLQLEQAQKGAAQGSAAIRQQAAGAVAEIEAWARGLLGSYHESAHRKLLREFFRYAESCIRAAKKQESTIEALKGELEFKAQTGDDAARRLRELQQSTDRERQQLEGARDALEAELKQSKAQAKDLEVKLAAESSALAFLREAISQKDSSNTALSSEVERAQKLLEVALDEKKWLEGQLATTTEQLYKAREQGQEQASSLEAQSDRIQGTEEQLRAALEEKRQLEAQLAANTEQLYKAREEGRGQASAIEDASERIKLTEEQLRAALEEKKWLEGQLETKAEALHKAQEEGRQKASSIEAVSGEIQQTQKQLQTTQGERDFLQQELDRAKEALEKAKQDGKDKAGSIESQAKEMQAGKKALAATQEERNFLKEELQRRDDALAKAKLDLKERDAALARCRAELDFLSKEVEARERAFQRQHERDQEERALELQRLELQREQREREQRKKREAAEGEAAPGPLGERPVTRGAKRIKDHEGALHSRQEAHKEQLEEAVVDCEARLKQVGDTEQRSKELVGKQHKAAEGLQAAQQRRQEAEGRLVAAIAETRIKTPETTPLDAASVEEIQALQRQLAEAEHRAEELRREAEAKEEERLEELQAAKLRVVQAETALEEETEQVKAHKAKVKEKERELLRLKGDRAELEREIEEARGQGEAGKERLQALLDQLEQKDDEVDRIRSENDSLHDRATELEEEQAMLRVRLQVELAEKEKRAHEARRALERELAEVAGQLAAAEKTRRKMRDALQATRGGPELEALRREVEQQDAQVDQAQQKVDLVEKQRKGLAAQQQEAEELRSQRADLIAKIRGLEAAIEGEAPGGGDPHLQKKYDELLEVKKQLVAQLRDAREEAKHAQAAASEEKLKEEIDKALAKKQAEHDKKLEKYKAKIQELKATIADLEQQLKEMREKCARLTEVERELQDMKEMAGGADDLRKECAELRKTTREALKRLAEVEELWRKEVISRKKLFNEVQDLKGKIRVMVRCRPMNSIEKSKKSEIVMDFPDEYQLNVPKKKKEFIFDFVFGPTSTQEMVWEESKHFCQSAVDGYNTCIFAYGQTGSGKTHTMEGNPEMPGLTPRCINEVYEIVEKMTGTCDFSISCYMLELYTDNLHDLLLTPEQKKAPPALDIKKDSKGMVFVQGALVRPCETREELARTYMDGCKSRHVRATGMNAASSRSHLVFGIMIETQQRSTGKVTVGKMSLVDLAGSERMDKTGIKDHQGQREAMSINKSLTALGDVIRALSTDPGGFIPYRNNKLTLLMSDSLGGNAKTMMIAAVSPASYNIDESCNTLAYASNTKNITNDAQKHQESKEIARLKAIIVKLRKGEQVEAGEEH